MHEHTLSAENAMRAADGSRRALPALKRRNAFLSSLYGMLAEILFSLGLLGIGLAISLLGGW